MSTLNNREYSEEPFCSDSQNSANRNASDPLLVVGIGGSAGGEKALAAFFEHLPEMHGMAFVVIVHLSPEHDRQMAELLQQYTEMPVTQVNERVRMKAGNAYVIPPGKDLSMTDGHIHLSDQPPMHLRITPGRPMQHFLNLLPTELRLELRPALHQGFRKTRRTRSRAIPVRVDGRLRNEEMQSINEELRATAEALETSNAELQSVNEELEALIGTLENLLSARADQIKQLASELILAEQCERQRIAQILHDDLQQLLYAFKIKTEKLSRDLSKEQGIRLAGANMLIDGALDITRTLTVELSPPVLKGDDITVTLNWLALQMEEMHNLKVEVGSSGPVRVRADLRVLVYQIVRELLFNVVKHAGIDRARVNLVEEKDQLILVVQDEGAGFDMSAVQEQWRAQEGGFGLHSVTRRLDLIGGRLEMESTPGQGTRATLFVPLGTEHVGEVAMLPEDKHSKPSATNEKVRLYR